MRSLLHPNTAQSLRRSLPETSTDSHARALEEHDRDRHFVALLTAFRDSGGLARGDEVADLMRMRGAGDVSQLARWIVTGQVISFEWRGELWVPLFQFNQQQMNLRAVATAVAAELSPVLSGWDLAVWCATPLDQLGGLAPADAAATDMDRVVEAARELRQRTLPLSAVS